MTQKFFKTPQGIATGIAVVILALYPFSHFPLVPGLGISPFQLASLAVAVFGGYAAIVWIGRNKVVISDTDKAKGQPLAWMVVLLVWLSLSFLWGSRTTHELYYIGLVLASFLFALGIFTLLKVGGVSKDLIVRVVSIAGVVLSLGAVWQFVGESAGVDRAYTNICKTCLQYDIGVARSSGFSQEPEHFSTVLLAPLVLLLLLLVGQKLNKRSLSLWVGTACIVIALLLASSRSGLLALAFILCTFIVFAIRRQAKPFIYGLGGTCTVAVMLALGLVAWSGTVGEATGSKYTLERYVAHVSGGVVTLGGERERLSEVEDSIKQKVEVKSSESEEFNYVTDATNYGPSGAIVYSTQSRLETYKTAIAIWTQSVRNLLIGVGWGNFGAAAQARNPTAFNKNTIVNNQYLQVAVELGLIGVVLFIGSVVVAARFLYRSALDAKVKFAVYVLFVAYGIQLLFYSGLHLLQFWLSLAIVAYVLYANIQKPKSKPVKSSGKHIS